MDLLNYILSSLDDHLDVVEAFDFAASDGRNFTADCSFTDINSNILDVVAEIVCEVVRIFGQFIDNIDNYCDATMSSVRCDFLHDIFANIKDLVRDVNVDVDVFDFRDMKVFFVDINMSCILDFLHGIFNWLKAKVMISLAKPNNLVIIEGNGVDEPRVE